MFSASETRTLVNDLFEKEALVIGGLAATHPMDDEFVWRLMRSLDAIRTQVLRRLGEESPPDQESPDQPSMHRHPAVDEFLRNIRSGRP
ncbi:MAG: hypothetical protein OEY97_11050 [Nitrospirota bacterium]|nr:hypothetical protein [Nitrospirota bacterium]